VIKQCLGGYANHITQDTTSNTTDTAEPFTAAQYAQINQLGHDLSNPSAALADLAAMSQVMQEHFLEWSRTSKAELSQFLEQK